MSDDSVDKRSYSRHQSLLWVFKSNGGIISTMTTSTLIIGPEYNDWNHNDLLTIDLLFLERSSYLLNGSLLESGIFWSHYPVAVGCIALTSSNGSCSLVYILYKQFIYQVCYMLCYIYNCISFTHEATLHFPHVYFCVSSAVTLTHAQWHDLMLCDADIIKSMIIKCIIPIWFFFCLWTRV